MEKEFVIAVQPELRTPQLMTDLCAWSIEHKRGDVLDELLGSENLDLDLPVTSSGFRLIHLAVRFKSQEMLAKLLNHHIPPDIEARDDVGRTLLHHVIKSGDDTLFRFLLEKCPDADFGARDAYNETVLHYAVLRHAHATHVQSFEVLQYLLRNKKADINLEDDEGDTALMIAVKYCMPNVVELILQFRNEEFDINHANKSGQTALILLANLGPNHKLQKTHEFTRLTAMLLSFPGISVNHQCSNGKTAMHWLAIFMLKQHKAVDLFIGLQPQLDLTLEDRSGKIPADFTQRFLRKGDNFAIHHKFHKETWLQVLRAANVDDVLPEDLLNLLVDVVMGICSCAEGLQSIWGCYGRCLAHRINAKGVSGSLESGRGPKWRTLHDPRITSRNWEY